MQKTWEEVDGYEGRYRISNEGEVMSMPRLCAFKDGRSRKMGGSILKPVVERGYKRVCLTMRNQDKKIAVHRLVAKAFLVNPLNKPCVNHIDGDKLNNNVENLEWCTYSENSRHAYHVTKVLPPIFACSRMRPLVIKTISGEELIFNSKTDAANHFKCSANAVTNLLLGRTTRTRSLSDVSMIRLIEENSSLFKNLQQSAVRAVKRKKGIIVDSYEPDVDPLDFDYAAEMRYVMSNYQKLK